MPRSSLFPIALFPDKTTRKCITWLHVFCKSQVFFRGGPLTWVSDSPQRAKLLYCKHPNNSTKLPCPYCKAGQDDDLPTCGDLGNAKYDVEVNKRTWGEAQDGWRELQAMGPNPNNERTKRSAELGMVAPTRVSDGVLGRPLWDKVSINPARHVPVESLHADALVSLVLPAFRPSSIICVCIC